MHITRLIRHALAGIAAAAVIGLAGPVRATTVWFGSITSPASFEIGREALLGPFDDSYYFSIGQGASLAFSSFMSTGYSNRWAIPDMNAGLYNASLLLAGTAVTNHLPEGFPSRDVSFASKALEPGDYFLRVHGTATPFDSSLPITSSYHGRMDFASIGAPAPEPEALMLLAFGLGVVGCVTRRQTARGGQPKALGKP